MDYAFRKHAVYAERVLYRLQAPHNRYKYIGVSSVHPSYVPRIDRVRP